MIATQVRRMSGGRILTLAVLGGMAISTGVTYASPLPQAHVAPQHTWVNFDGQWLCRSWSDSAPVAKMIVPGTRDAASAVSTLWEFNPAGGRAYGMTAQTMTRCTTHWHIDSSLRLLSDDTAWAPNPTGEWPLASNLLAFDRPTHQVKPLVHTRTAIVKRRTTIRPTYTKPQTTSSTGSTGGTTSSSGGYNPWAPVPGHPTYRLGDFAGDPYSNVYGVCTWYAWYRDRGLPLSKLGQSGTWSYTAPKLGLSVGTKPVVGATVVFQPGVEGAGGTGHVGHVETVLGGGWFIISEMNFYWNGGGWGRVDYRYVYVRSGVSFIY